MGNMTHNFSRHEFECPCCGLCEMDRATVEKLQAVRTIYGKRMDIAEGGGYRCENYAESPYTAHREGKAIDPMVPREDLFKVVKLAYEAGFTGIFLKNRDGRWQLHLDTADAIENVRPRPWIGTY